jgi:hypothetical protein
MEVWRVVEVFLRRSWRYLRRSWRYGGRGGMEVVEVWRSWRYGGRGGVEACRHAGMEPQMSGDLEVWRLWRYGSEVWRSGGRVGMEVWRRGRVERDSKLRRRQEALEMVEISGGGWRRSKALEKVRGSGGGRRLRTQHCEALEAERQRSRGSEKVWK